MSESFWDPTKVTNLSFSEDPCTKFASLYRKLSWGQTISPTFGEIQRTLNLRH